MTTILTDGDSCAGSQTLSSRWSSMNVEITYCQLNHLVTGQLRFGGRMRDRRRRPGSGRLRSAHAYLGTKTSVPRTSPSTTQLTLTVRVS